MDERTIGSNETAVFLGEMGLSINPAHVVEVYDVLKPNRRVFRVRHIEEGHIMADRVFKFLPDIGNAQEEVHRLNLLARYGYRDTEHELSATVPLRNGALMIMPYLGATLGQLTGRNYLEKISTDT